MKQKINKKRKNNFFWNNTKTGRVRGSVTLLFMILILVTVILCIIPEKSKEDIEGRETYEEHAHDDAPSQAEDTLPEEKKEPPYSMALVIDDAGYSTSELEPFLKFPAPLTIAVLPQLPLSSETARLIRRAGKEVMLHQPMEPLGDNDPGPGALYTTYSDEEIVAVLEKNLSTVPGAVGANNHMGSKATADAHLMCVVLNFFKKKGMYFLDSKTTADSQAQVTARLSGIPFYERNVFLDYEADIDIIRTQMRKGIKQATSAGHAILIGHVQNKEVIEVLGEFISILKEENIRLVKLSEIK
jgi:polysaccharide deacetylase 2 family uncharacterized protein YibQ